MFSTLVLSILWFQSQGPTNAPPQELQITLQVPRGGIPRVAMSLGKPSSFATPRETGH